MSHTALTHFTPSLSVFMCSTYLSLSASSFNPLYSSPSNAPVCFIPGVSPWLFALPHPAFFSLPSATLPRTNPLSLSPSNCLSMVSSFLQLLFLLRLTLLLQLFLAPPAFPKLLPFPHLQLLLLFLSFLLSE